MVSGVWVLKRRQFRQYQTGKFQYRASLGAQYRWDNIIDAPYHFVMPVLTENPRQCQYVQERDVEEPLDTPAPRRPLGPVPPSVGQFHEAHCGPALAALGQLQLRWARSLSRPVLPQSGRQDRKDGTDTFFLKEGQNVFCPYITVEEGL